MTDDITGESHLKGRGLVSGVEPESDEAGRLKGKGLSIGVKEEEEGGLVPGAKIYNRDSGEYEVIETVPRPERGLVLLRLRSLAVNSTVNIVVSKVDAPDGLWSTTPRA